MTNETLNLTINRMIIVDQVAAFLYATKQVPESSEITNIQFSDLFGASTEEFCTLKVNIKGKEVLN
jgi:hypothetical protein